MTSNTYQRFIEKSPHFYWQYIVRAFEHLPLGCGVAIETLYRRDDIIDEVTLHLQGFHQYASCSAHIYMCSFILSDQHYIVCVYPDPDAGEYKKILGGRLRQEQIGIDVDNWGSQIIGLIDRVIKEQGILQ